MRPFLLACLTLLQIIAPLAHAHAAQQESVFGLHVPGLETVRTDNSILAEQTDHCLSNTGNFIFNVEDGIKQSRSIPNKPAQQDCPLILRYIAINNVSLSFPSDSFFLPPQLALQSGNSLLSPRAPPNVNSGTP
ncbi:hypothetical protein [Methylosarcina fibrata]|uniref:hypothetical protein n=1 Tax=Methylosarcina fibrata TaxID=105972 RepID=UPI00037866FA|nr:hypothetical protein [Methylosarcina fibrata]